MWLLLKGSAATYVIIKSIVVHIMQYLCISRSHLLMVLTINSGGYFRLHHPPVIISADSISPFPLFLQSRAGKTWLQDGDVVVGVWWHRIWTLALKYSGVYTRPVWESYFVSFSNVEVVNRNKKCLEKIASLFFFFHGAFKGKWRQNKGCFQPYTSSTCTSLSPPQALGRAPEGEIIHCRVCQAQGGGLSTGPSQPALPCPGLPPLSSGPFSSARHSRESSAELEANLSSAATPHPHPPTATKWFLLVLCRLSVPNEMKWMPVRPKVGFHPENNGG